RSKAPRMPRWGRAALSTLRKQQSFSLSVPPEGANCSFPLPDWTDPAGELFRGRECAPQAVARLGPRRPRCASKTRSTPGGRLASGHVEHRRVEAEHALADGLEHAIARRWHQGAGPEIAERPLGRIVFVRAAASDDLDDLRGDVKADFRRQILGTVGERAEL